MKTFNRASVSSDPSSPQDNHSQCFALLVRVTLNQVFDNNNNGIIFKRSSSRADGMESLDSFSSLLVIAYIYIFRRCPWCNGYCRRKWTR